MSSLDFKQRYGNTLAELAKMNRAQAAELPALEALMQTIRETVSEGPVSFASFEQFFSWWDVTTAYDQLDDGANVEEHKPSLKVAYDALVADGFFVGLASPLDAGLPHIQHPFTEYSLEDAVQLAIATQRIRQLPEPTTLGEVRDVIVDMANRASHLWCTGMAALDVLDAAIDARDLRKSCRLC